MSGSVHVPFYGTVFRGDQLHRNLLEIAAVSMHYGATEWSVYRYNDDAYKMLLSVDFESKDDWDRYWNGPEFIRATTRCRFSTAGLNAPPALTAPSRLSRLSPPVDAAWRSSCG